MYSDVAHVATDYIALACPERLCLQRYPWTYLVTNLLASLATTRTLHSIHGWSKVVRLLEPNDSAPGAEWRRMRAWRRMAPNGAERLRRTILAPNWRRTLAPNGAGAELFPPIGICLCCGGVRSPASLPAIQWQSSAPGAEWLEPNGAEWRRMASLHWAPVCQVHDIRVTMCHL